VPLFVSTRLSSTSLLRYTLVDVYFHLYYNSDLHFIFTFQFILISMTVFRDFDFTIFNFSISIYLFSFDLTVICLAEYPFLSPILAFSPLQLLIKKTQLLRPFLRIHFPPVILFFPFFETKLFSFFDFFHYDFSFFPFEPEILRRLRLPHRNAEKQYSTTGWWIRVRKRQICRPQDYIGGTGSVSIGNEFMIMSYVNRWISKIALANLRI
jgi:hypothetical protein